MLNKYYVQSAHRNLKWAIADILNDNGYSANEYTLQIEYPDNENEIAKDTAIVYNLNVTRKYTYEIGSEDSFYFSGEISVISHSRSKMDQICNLLLDKFNDIHYDFYDMSTANPTTIGDYSGLTDIGTMLFHNVEYMQLPVIGYRADKNRVYEGVVRFDINII